MQVLRKSRWRACCLAGRPTEGEGRGSTRAVEAGERSWGRSYSVKPVKKTTAGVGLKIESGQSSCITDSTERDFGECISYNLSLHKAVAPNSVCTGRPLSAVLSLLHDRSYSVILMSESAGTSPIKLHMHRNRTPNTMLRPPSIPCDLPSYATTDVPE